MSFCAIENTTLKSSDSNSEKFPVTSFLEYIDVFKVPFEKSSSNKKPKAKTLSPDFGIEFLQMKFLQKVLRLIFCSGRC